MATPWLDHFKSMFRMVTGCDLVEARFADPAWREAAVENDFWPNLDTDSDYTLLAYIHYGYGIKTLVGAFRIRDDDFFYGGVVGDGGNHDLSIGELVSIFKRAQERLYDDKLAEEAKSRTRS